MKNRKPRTATDRKVNRMLAEGGSICEWWDGGYPECFLPWAGSGEHECGGNPFVCRKCYYRHLASAKKLNKQAVLDFEERERCSGRKK